MSLVSEFADSELYYIRERLTQWYKKDVEIELADCGLVVDKNTEQSISYPTVFWYAQGTNLVVFKLGLGQYKGQFFYTPHNQYETEIERYTDLDECVVALLQTHADHEREQVVCSSSRDRASNPR